MRIEKLSDLADIILGYPFPSEGFNTEGQGISTVRGMNVTERALRFGEDARFWSDFSIPLDNYYLKENDIVIGMDGSKVGRNFAIVRKEDLPLLLVQRVACIRAKKCAYQPYLWAWISSPRFVEYINTIKTGSSIPHISGKQIGDYSIAVPSFDEQKRIGDTIWNLEGMISNNNAIITELDSMAKDIYDYWFVQFDFPDENERPYKSSGGKMVWNEELKREIPEKWEVKAISSLVSASRGISYSTESITGSAGVPMINLASFNVDASYKPAGLKTFSGVYSCEDVLHPFDLIMCNTQQTDLDPKKDIIGKTMLVPDLFDGDIVASHHITRLQTEDISMRVFLNATGKTAWFHKAMSGHCSGTSILGLDVKHALEYRLPIPEKSIRLSFSEKIMQIEKQKCVLMRENTELTALRDWLLPMLMNGQVKVG